MLAAFGRGALGTLTDRFNQYDAALESVATHEGQIASINQGKTSWANGGTVSSETYYNILKGTQDSFTLPFDLNGFISGITANGNAQRYSGVMFAVSYANTPGQPKQCSDTLYLPFAAVNAEKGVVAFEDLQFRYADLQNDDVDVRYKVTPVSGSQIKLEKVEESANKPDTPTDIPQQPFTFVVNGDNLKIGSWKLDLVVLNGCYLGSEFSVVLPTDIQSKLNGIIGELNTVFSETASSDFSVRTSDITSRMPKFFLRVSGEAMICFQSAQNHSLGEYGYRLSFYATICDTDAYSSTRWLADYTSNDGRLTFRCIKNEAVQDLS